MKDPKLARLTDNMLAALRNIEVGLPMFTGFAAVTLIDGGQDRIRTGLFRRELVEYVEGTFRVVLTELGRQALEEAS